MNTLETYPKIQKGALPKTKLKNGMSDYYKEFIVKLFLLSHVLLKTYIVKVRLHCPLSLPWDSELEVGSPHGQFNKIVQVRSMFFVE